MEFKHEFSTPRNLYEKLLRDSDRLDADLSGDNFFNFIITANHLKNWIKKSPMSSNETTKRLLRKINSDTMMKKCCNSINNAQDFSVIKNSSNNKVELIIETDSFDIKEVKDAILSMYSGFFDTK